MLVYLIIVTWLSGTNGAKMLFFCPVPAYIHQKMYKAVWTELALRGHVVYVVTPNPVFNRSMVNLTEYDISSVSEFERSQIRPEWKTAFYKKPNFFGVIFRQFLIQFISGDGMEFLYNHSEVQKLISEHKSFDLCLFEWFHPAVAVYSHIFQCPFIGLGSNSLPTQMHDSVGNLHHPIIAPEQDLPILRNSITFFQRLWSVFWVVFVRLHQNYVLLPMEDARIKKFYGNNIPYLKDISKNISFLILNRNPVFHRPVPNVPAVIELGSIAYKRQPVKIDSELKLFLDEAKEGVVYFSLGSSMQGTSMPKEYFQRIQNTFKKLSYRVVWKWEDDHMINKPDNVFIAKFVPQVYVLVFLSVHVIGSKILFLTVFPTFSHQKPFQTIWKELSLRGHDVHVLTPNPLNDPNLINLTEYDISDAYDLARNMASDNLAYMFHKPSFISAFSKDVFMTKMLSRYYQWVLNHREIKRILTDNQNFDVVIAEWLFPTLAALGAIYQAPLVGVTSLGAPLVALDTLGNPSHPIVAPDMNLPLHRDLSFKERMLSFLYAVFVRLHYHWVVLPREDANVKEFLKDDLPYLGDIEKNISVLLMNRNPVFHRIMPLFPNVVDLGGIVTKSKNVPLGDDLKRYLDSSTNGVIYFSFGSSMPSILLESRTIKILQNVFDSLPFDFVWKWENDTMEGKPANVLIDKWIPQIALLEHPNVKLFITQGGLQSIEEAINAHKPIIGIPFHSDQTTNVDTCVMYGMGKLLDLEDLTEEVLSSYILDILKDARYSENAKKLDELMKDQPQDGLDKAIWWIEYAARYKGATHLRSVAVDLPWWQYLLLDVIAFVLAIILSVYLILRFILNLIKKLLFKTKPKSTKVIEKKKKKQ